MADKIKLVQGDTRPALVVTLTDEVTGLPINITGATPRLKFRKAAAATLTATLDRFMPGWMKGPTASTVKHWMDDQQPDTFYVYPAQNSTPAKVVITHSFTPPALTANGTLGVRDIYQAAIENYILFRAFSKDAEPASAERAVAFAKAFYES